MNIYFQYLVQKKKFALANYTWQNYLALISNDYHKIVIQNFRLKKIHIHHDRHHQQRQED